LNSIAPHSISSDRILAEQIKTLYDSISSLVMINLVVSGALTFAFWNIVEHRWLLAWMAAILLMLAIRLGIYFLFKQQFDQGNLQRYRRFLIMGSLSAGIIWGAGGLIMFVPAPFEYQLLILLSLLAMGSGSAFSLSIYLPAYFAFVPVMLVPITLFLFTIGDSIYTALGSVTLVFLIAQTFFNVKINKGLNRAMELRFENLDLIDQLQEQKVEAERANSAKSRFLATASHDLRQPLYALTLFTSALEERVESSETRKIAHQIKRSTDALQSLFDALLDISKLDAGTLDIQKKDFSLQSVLARLADEFDPRAAELGLSYDWPKEFLMVNSDPILLEQILRNFLSNAVRYTNTGGITVTCEPYGNDLKISVADTGIGIPAGDQNAIFEEFYQIGNPERDRQKGLGLGLSIVERAARQLGHEIQISSEPGRGSTFSVCVGKASTPDSQIAAAAATTPTASFDAKPLIVVIDDEASIRDGLEQLLQLWGCEVIASANQDDAIAQTHSHLRLHHHNPDGIICDFRLRDNRTGLEAIDAINAEFDLNTPALIVTGDTEKALLIELKSSGHQVLHKPVPPAKLRAFLRSLASQTANSTVEKTKA
jgi:two-component system, sensor histidine kinase